tara:strand:+ start:575 stop:820 length:246 start_codon:yes stop_codon:yes gene_type:complete
MILEVDDVEFGGRAYCALIQMRPANPDGAADEREPSFEVLHLWIDRPPCNWDEIDPEENKQAADACVDAFRERFPYHCEWR